MLKPIDNYYIGEEDYTIENEALHAALFTTGNGYMGVRGSYEEFGSLRIQGCYVRGLFDEIYEIIEPFSDNVYMKKYYFDEEKLKNFEKQDSIVNFADILLVRISVSGQTFYPWEGKVLSWNRYLDMKTACLIREVRWDNGFGHITKLRFERFASFDNDNTYCIKVSVTPENHNEEMKILSGIDTHVKTGGQKISKSLTYEYKDNTVFYKALAGEKYRFEYGIAANSRLCSDNKPMDIEFIEKEQDGILAGEASFVSECGKEYVLEKTIFVITSREYQGDVLDGAKVGMENQKNKTYEQLFTEHKKSWELYFEMMDIQIDGDNEADSVLRFSSYHTAISASRNDSVHSISAKSLSGERYNNFIWWDCEVYQLPIFISTQPDTAKLALMYRYNTLESARKNAENEGYKGARYAFVSSVNGDEKVWEYVRHPFYQVHITADVAWGVLNYLKHTGDNEFMQAYGLEILWECARYWASRVELAGDRYEIKMVTGTDEHHPYVNNDAYTNYLVNVIMKGAVELYGQNVDCGVVEKLGITKTEVANWKDVTDRLYLPIDKATGMIPQFDNYFDLSRTLEQAGGNTAKQFQMKQSGLYHQSQIIKQPDVMLLFSYLDIPFDKEVYRRNWDYYEAMCETASSLSFPVHAICSADNGRLYSAYRHFLQTARIDLDDIHSCGWQGIHAGCAAGAWYSLFRGVAGIVCTNECITIDPHMFPWWDKVALKFYWHGNKMSITMSNSEFEIVSDVSNKEAVPIWFTGQAYTLAPTESKKFRISLNK